MEPAAAAAPKRRFAGRRRAAPGREDALAAVADALLSAVPPALRAVGSVAGEGAPPRPAPAAARGPPALADAGLYVLVAGGVEPEGRRRTALAVACRLTPPCRSGAVFLFEQGRADAHLLGEVACGRLGPQSYAASDPARVATMLRDRCDEVGVLLADPADGRARRLARGAKRAVFIARPDAESLVETYRDMKLWRDAGAAWDAGLFVVGCDDAGQARRLHERLGRTARRFLGWDLAVRGHMAEDPAAPAWDHPDPIRILAEAPADQVWTGLAAPAAPEAPPLAAGAAEPGSGPPPAAAPTAAPEEAVFAWWRPEQRSDLLAAVEAQVPAMLAGTLRQVLRTEVDEPGAPPLAAVRRDGALVAVLLADAGGAADTGAAERWLRRHARLLARAYPSAGIAAESAPGSVVVAPLAPAAGGDGVRRFVPVRLGGQRGVVFLP